MVFRCFLRFPKLPRCDLDIKLRRSVKTLWYFIFFTFFFKPNPNVPSRNLGDQCLLGLSQTRTWHPFVFEKLFSFKLFVVPRHRATLFVITHARFGTFSSLLTFSPSNKRITRLLSD